jgi:hypothetical protein
MSKTELKVVDGDEQASTPIDKSPEQADEFTEESPPLHVDPKSFNARIAGIESCSVARELAKHWALVTAFVIERLIIATYTESKKPSYLWLEAKFDEALLRASFAICTRALPVNSRWKNSGKLS